MASGRDEPQPYEGEGGGGAGGKFRKKPFRRSVQATPYDRPTPNPATLAFRTSSGGTNWLSKLVDPAQRLITSGAHKLFSSVFRKRLTHPLAPTDRDKLHETNSEAQVKLQSAAVAGFHGVQKKSIDQSGEPSHSASGGELTDLEQVLKKKTFTRSEIDHLTALLHSRTVDLEIDDKGKRPEVDPIKQVVASSSRETFPTTPAPGIRMGTETFPKIPDQGTRIENLLTLSPVIKSTACEGSVASATEIAERAKSYMHKNPTSPCMLGFRNQATVGNSTAMHARNLHSPARLPFTPIVPRITSGHADTRENGYITPRSRGRSAIYSMARTPYSRIHPTNPSMGYANPIGIYGGAASSQYGSGGQKRRNSVLENDIGSVGPMRRIRQKPNLLSSRGLSLPVTEGSQNPSSSRLKSMSFGEQLHQTTKPSAEDGNNRMRDTTVPSKSSEMASKILQQLDKLVSPADKPSGSKIHALMDKSPGKLSPSMLRGQALKSLEHVDSSKFMGEIQHLKSIDDSPKKIVADAKEPNSLEQAKIKESNPLKFGSAYNKFTSKVNGSAMPKENGEDSTLLRKDAVIGTRVSASLNTVSPQKKRAFQMSAPEDFVDLDEDNIPNGTASDSLFEGRKKANLSESEGKNAATEFVNVEKASGSTEVGSVLTEKLNSKTNVGTPSSSTAEKSTSLLSFQNTFSPSTAVFPSAVNVESSVSPPTFNFGGKVVSAKDANAVNFGFKAVEKAPESQVTFSALSNIPKFTAGATDTLPKLPEPDKSENVNSAVSSKIIEAATQPAASTSSSNTSSFSMPTSNNASLTNGSATSTKSAPPVFSTLTGQSSSASATFTFASTGGGLVSLNSTQSVPAYSGFKYESPTTPVLKPSSEPVVPVFNYSASASASTPVSETSSAALVIKFASTASMLASETSAPPAPSLFAPVSETSAPLKTKRDASFANLSDQSAPAAGGSASLFGFTASTTSASANQSPGSIFATGSVSGIAVPALTQSSPLQFSSSAPSPTFGLTGSTTSSLDAKPVTTQVPGSTTSSSSTPSVFVSTWQQQQPKPPVFSFSSSPSTGFSFAPSTASTPTPATNSSPSTGYSFAASTAALSSSPSTGFSFTASSAPSAAAAATNSTQSSGYVFGPTPNSLVATNTSPSTGFSFNQPSVSVAFTSPSPFGLNSAVAPVAFTSTNGAASSSSSLFSYNSSSTAAPSQPVFSNPSAGFEFRVASPGNNDQMSMEDSMAEDTMQASAAAAAPAVSIFGQQQPVSQSPPGFAFNSTVAPPAPAAGNPFQFGGQPNVVNPQNPSPFQASGSLGSNFSMGSRGSGVDKSNRKYVKVKHRQRKK